MQNTAHDITTVDCAAHGRIYAGPAAHAPDECPKCKNMEACLHWSYEHWADPSRNDPNMPEKCGECWCCKGEEPPMHLMPNEDADPEVERAIRQGEAEAKACIRAYECGDCDDPYVLLAQMYGD